MLDFEKNINQHLGFVNNSDKFESLVTEYISDSPPSIKENADFKVIKDNLLFLDLLAVIYLKT